MKPVKQLKVSISTKSKRLDREAQIFAYTSKDATKRAVFAYVASLVLAVICVAIPIVHFIAVPALLIGGPIFAFFIFKVFLGQEDLRVSDARCPECQASLPLSETRKLWPLREQCENCGAHYLAEIVGE